MMNSMNNYLLALSPQDVLILMKTKYPVNVLGFGVVISAGDMMSPFIFPHSFWFNIKVYSKFLEEIVLPLIERVVAERPYTW